MDAITATINVKTNKNDIPENKNVSVLSSQKEENNLEKERLVKKKEKE